MKKTQLFQYGKPVTGSELVGRKKDIEIILRDLRGGQSLLIPGPRRIGKSSIVLEVLNQCKKEGWDTAYIDLMGVNTIHGLANEITAAIIDAENGKLKRLMRRLTTPLKELLKIKEFKIVYQEFEAIATLRDSNTPEIDAFKESLELLEALTKKRKKKLICAFDEFGEINSLGTGLTRIMRSQFQLHKNVTYLFSGSQESILNQMFSNPKQPFFGFSKEIQLSPIDRGEFAAYIQKNFKKENIHVTDLMAREICAWTASHPFYTMVFANHLYEYVVMNNISRINDNNREILEQGYRKAFQSLKNDLERLWSELGAGVTRQVCAYLALHMDPLNQKIFAKDGLKNQIETARIAQSLRTLESKGIIRKVKRGEYTFINHFFGDYIYSLYDPEYESTFLK